MFSKPSKSEFLPEPMMLTTETGRRGPKVASLIAEDLVIEGGLSGDVKVSRLSIGETGSVEGSIQAESVDCRGAVTGSITAQQVRLFGAAHVDGDITHDQLTVETGAYFQGRSLKLPRTQSAPVEVPSIAAE